MDRRDGGAPIVFALANPDPEIDPAEAGQHAAVVASGRSDYPNQINNVLAFPGVFRGLLDSRASDITIDMLLRAADAIAHVVTDQELNASYIIPSVFDEKVPKAVAEAITRADPQRDQRLPRHRAEQAAHRLGVEEPAVRGGVDQPERGVHRRPPLLARQVGVERAQLADPHVDVLALGVAHLLARLERQRGPVAVLHDDQRPCARWRSSRASRSASCRASAGTRRVAAPAAGPRRAAPR